MSYEQLAKSVDNLTDKTRVLAAGTQTAVGKLDLHTGDAAAHPELVALVRAESSRAEVAANVAQLSAGIYDTTALGLAATTNGKYFSTPSPDAASYLILYKNDAGAAVYVDTYPSKAALDEIGIEGQSSAVSGLSFSIVDDANNRTWLEADLAGKPSEYSATKIGEALTETTAPVLFKTIKDAAVTEAVVTTGVEELSDLNNQSFAMVDDNNQRLWLEADLSGGPTPYAATKIGASLTETTAPVLFTDIKNKAVTETLVAMGIEELSALNDGLSFSIVDGTGNRTWLEADLAGKPTPYAIDSIVARLPGGLGEAPNTYQSGKKGSLGIVSGPNITCWGDSMTAGAGGGGTTYPAVLQSLLTAAGYTSTVTNRGIGGENSPTICARAGGNPFIVLVANGVIPATTTPFEIVLQPINGLVPKPLLQGASSYSGRLGKIKGIFSRTVTDSVYTYFFTRSVAGTEETATRPLPLYLDIGDQARGDIAIIWIGQNGPNDVRAIQDAKAIIQRLTALDKRYLVISKPGGSSTSDIDDAMWFADFGRRFIPIRQYLSKYGLEDVGITPTAQDITDMANGTVPTSLRFDGVHWLGPSYSILANIIFQRLIELEWI